MKRHRIVIWDFDTRAHILAQPISEDWDEEAQRHHRDNRDGTLEALRRQFGEHAFETKLANFMALGPKSFSVVAYHNRFYEQIRCAFVVGAYYPALVGVCALGERVLNQLLLRLRDDYKSHPTYKKVYRKDSFDDWDLAITTLAEWGVLQDAAAVAFNELKDKRHAAVHFRPEVDADHASLALGAIHCFGRMIESQFAGIGALPWMLSGVPGEVYIRKDWESFPFVREFYIPTSPLVGPLHEIVEVMPRVVIRDSGDYPTRDVSDEEFVEMRKRGGSAS